MRTGWHGVGLEVDGPDEMLAEVARHLPPFYDDQQPLVAAVRLFTEDGGYALEVEGERPSRFVPNYPTLLDVANLLELAVVERLPDLVAVHAGAVALDGRALLLPGRTQTGKTRLVTALLEQGATYLSDEFALLDEDGRVHPYPRLLALREDERVHRLVATTFGAEPAAGSYSVGAVALLTYDAEVAGLAADELSASGVWLQLMEHCISVHRRPEASFAALTSVAAGAGGLHGRRGEAASTWPSFTGLLRSRS